MNFKNIEDLIYGIDTDINVEISFLGDENKTYFYTVKQLQRKQKLLDLCIFDYDYDSIRRELRILVKK